MAEKEHILITGANGLLGRQAALLMKDDYTVHAVVRKMPVMPIEDVLYHEIDLATPAWSADSLPKNVEAVFHLAQSQKFREFPEGALDVFGVNVHTTARLLDYARQVGAKRFIYASSGGVYGAGTQAFKENSPITQTGKLGYYLGSKLCSEILVETYSQIMTVGILRFFFIYGKEQNRTMLIPRLVDSIRAGKPVTLQGTEGLSINPIHVSDAAKALEKMMLVDESCTLNIAGTEVLSLRDIANTIGKAVGKQVIFENSAGEPGNLIANIDEMKRRLVTPETTFEIGVQELL